MKTKLIEKDEFETDFLQGFETKECMHTLYLLDFIDWEYSGCVLSRSSRINKSSNRSSRRTSYLIDADRSTLSFDPEALDRLRD